MYFKKLYVGGSAANPPHFGHKALIKLLLNKVDESSKVIWIPSGSRSDKPNLANHKDRKIMTQMLFEDITDPRFEIDFTDLEASQNRPTIDILEELQTKNPKSQVIWYTGVDSVIPQDKYDGQGEIEAKWHRGKELMQNWSFLILPRPNYSDPNHLILPKQFEVLDWEGQEKHLLDRSSSEIVNLIQSKQSWEHLYGGPDNKIVEYIKQNHLYGWEG